MQPQSHAATRPPRDLTLRQEMASLTFLLAGLVAVLIWRWVGYQGSDDHSYAVAAQEWLTGPVLGADHWSLRLPIVLPASLLFRWFGQSEFTLALTNLSYFLAFLTLGYVFVRRWLGAATALVWLALLAPLPGFAVMATYVNTDMAELFFVAASFMLYLKARLESPASSTLVLSGLTAGLAFLVRETTLALILTYGVLFVFSPGMARRHYVLIAAAAAAIVTAEFAYFWAMSDDPLYRLNISAHHDPVNRVIEAATVVKGGEIIDSEGVLSVNIFLDPILILFVSQKYGWLFWLGLPATVWAAGRLEGHRRDLARLFGILFLCWFLFLSLNAGILYLVPRYHMVSALAVSVPLALLLVELARRGRMKVAALAGAAITLSTTGLLYLENADPLFGIRALVRAASATAEPIYTDPQTLAKARLLLAFGNLTERVKAEVPPAGALVAVRPGFLEQCERSKYCRPTALTRALDPRPDWREEARATAPTRALGSILRRLPGHAAIPEVILRRIERPNEDLVFYRLPKPQSAENR